MDPAPEPSQKPEDGNAPPTGGGFGVWFAGACVAAVGLLIIGLQSRRPRQAPGESYDFGGQRAGLVDIPQRSVSSMPGVTAGDTSPSSLTPSSVVPLRRPESGGGVPDEAPQGSPGEIFSQTLAAHRPFYAQLAAKYSEESPVVRRFFDEWRHSPDLAKLSADYVRDQDAIKFARGAARSENFSRLMKHYTLEADLRNYGMELLMGSPHDVMTAWTNYTSSDPEGSALQTRLFEAMGVPVPMAQVLGNGKTDAGQMETQVKALLPALLKGVDPKVLQQVQQMTQQQGQQPPPQH